MYTFNTPEPVNLRVEVWVGQVEIYGEETTETTVELKPLNHDSNAQDLIDDTRVEQRGNEIVVLMPKVKSGLFGRRGQVRATIRVPRDSNIKVETASADLDTHGRLGDAKTVSGSGDVRLEHVAECEVRTGSGDITIGTATGSVDSKCGSGDAVVGSVNGDGDFLAGSGDVVIDSIDGSLKIKTGSGDILIKSSGPSVDALAGSGDLMVRRIAEGRLKAKTGSGDISIGVADGTAAYLDVMTVTGDVTSTLDSTDAPADGDQTVELIVQAGSGDVVLRRA